MDSCLNKKDNLNPTHFTQELFLVPRSSVDPPNEILKRVALETRTMETEIKDAQLGRLSFNNSENFEIAPNGREISRESLQKIRKLLNFWEESQIKRKFPEEISENFSTLPRL